MTKGNKGKTSTHRTQSRGSVLPGLDRVREKAQKEKELKFTALMHHITPEHLEISFYELKRNAAPGLDKVMWRNYKEDLQSNIEQLYERVHQGSYRATPSKRTYIVKEDGRKRPLGISIVEDKIVQQALATVLNQIYETIFLGFSYGFRQKRSQHDALDALHMVITNRKVNWVLDADISGFFDNINHKYMMMFIEHKISDKRVLRLIKKWLTVGYIEDGKRERQKVGTPQGSVISPLLANIYLHYTLDLWVNQWRKTKARGEVYIVRYADDFVVGFQYREDAERFHEELERRLQKFNLKLHTEKTRLIEFGRFAEQNQRKRNKGKPETFNFLGFTHICSKNRNGKFMLRRKTNKKKLLKKMQEIKEELRGRMHDNVKEVGKWLSSVIRGYQNYYEFPEIWMQ